MSLGGPEPLGPLHRLENFDCGKPTVNGWLVRHARHAQGSGSAKTFVVSEDDQLFQPERRPYRHAGCARAHSQGHGAVSDPRRDPCPSGRRSAGSGPRIGIGLLQDAIRRTLLAAEQAGVRAMLTHPIDEDARFFTRFGFIGSPLREQQLLLLLKDARRWVK